MGEREKNPWKSQHYAGGNLIFELGLVAQACNPSTQEAEVRGCEREASVWGRNWKRGNKEKERQEGETRGAVSWWFSSFSKKTKLFLSYILCSLGISSKGNQEFAIKRKLRKRAERPPFRWNTCVRGVCLLIISVASLLISRPRTHAFLVDLITTFPTRFPPGILLAEVTDDPIPS